MRSTRREIRIEFITVNRIVITLVLFLVGCSTTNLYLETKTLKSVEQRLNNIDSMRAIFYESGWHVRVEEIKRTDKKVEFAIHSYKTGMEGVVKINKKTLVLLKKTEGDLYEIKIKSRDPRIKNRLKKYLLY